MRKQLCLLTVLLVVTAATVSAQTEKGDWMVGGNFALNTAKNNAVFSLTPSAGYFFARNFVGGGIFSFTYSKQGDAKSTSVGAGPFARYYFGNSHLKPMVVAEFVFGNTADKLGTEKVNSSYRSMLLGGGLAAFVNENVAIETIAGYNRSKREDFDGSNGFALKVGFQVYLSPRGMLDTYKKR